MIKWMQSNGKYLMAFFGVLLMLVYILPSATKYGNPHGNDSIRGYMGTLAVYQSDLQRYRSEWDYLNHFAFAQQEVPAEEGMPAERTWAPIGRMLGPEAFEQFRQHPDMYALLIEEARQMGVGVSRDQLENLITSEVRTPDETGTKVIKPSESPDPERMDNLRASLTDFLLVENAFERAATTIKASAPLSQHWLATRHQEISLNMVEFSAAPYLAKVPAPTQAEMQKQFDEYSDIDPAKADLRSNPFDFGYRYPNRMQLQYISVPRSAVMDAALRTRNQNDQTRYDWDVAAYRYYQAHQSLYAATQPQNSLSFLPDAPQPKTIRPFKEVTDEVRQSVLLDDADKLSLTIRQRIVSQLAADYLAWKNAGGGAGHAPVSDVGVAYDSPDYLTRLALMIQKNYGVLPTVVTEGSWQTAATLDSLAGISSASIDDPDMRPLPFAYYAMNYYSEFVAPDQPDASNAIGLYEPSMTLKGGNDDFYIFRITAAQVSHKPANLAEVADQVRFDLQSAAAYAMAQGDAEKFLATAQSAHSVSVPTKGIIPLLNVGPIQFGQTDPVTGYATLSPKATMQFTHNAFDLLSLASPTNSQPIGLIPVQLDGRVLVAQVSGIQPMWSPVATIPVLQSQAAATVRQELATELRSHWFNYDDLIARTDYQEQKQTAQPSPPAPAQPNPPAL
jgi:hypothetical protein